MTKARTLLLAATLVFASFLDAGATVWGAKSLAPGGQTPSSSPTHLYRFEENLAGGVTDLGPIALAAGPQLDVDALAISPVHGLLGYSLSGTGAQLVSIDMTSAVATPIGAELAGRDIRGAGFVGSRLYVIDASGDELIEIDPATGLIIGSPVSITLAGPVFDVSNGVDITVDVTGDVYLVSFQKFFLIDLSTGALTPVFEDLVPGDGCATNPVFHVGATFSDAGPSDRLFTFEANCSDDLYRYDTGSGFSRAVLAADIIPSFNAGRGDLAALVTPPAAVPAWSGGSLAATAGALMLLLGLALARRVSP